MSAVRAAGLVLVLAAAVGIRVVGWFEIRNGPLPWLHRWTESDMAFFHTWARAVAAGDVLGRETPRPYHSGHAGVARAAHAASGHPATFDEAVGRRIWAGWLGERTFYQEPLYPYAVASLYAAAGPRTGLVVLAQAALGVAAAVLAWAIARALFGPAAGAVAGVLAALYGPQVFHETLLLRDAPLAALGLGLLAALLAAWRRPASRARAFGAGLLAGLAVLLKSSALLFVAPAALLFARRGGRVGALVAGVLVALAPLVARNVAVGAPALALAASGPHAFLYYNAADYHPFAGATTSSAAPEIMAQTGGHWLPVVRATIATHGSLAGWLALLAGKLGAAWHWLEVPDNASYAYWRLEAPRAASLAVEFWLLAPLAAVGAVVALRRGLPAALVVLLAAAALAANVAFYTSSRLRLPVALAMTPLAGAGVAALAAAAAGRRWRQLALLALPGVAAAALVLRPAPPGFTGLRVADYGVANEITAHLARGRAAAGDAAAARALLERRLETEPAALRALDPAVGESHLSPEAAAVAGSFARLHALAARLGGDPAHAEQARRLRVVAAQYAAARRQERP